MKITKSMQAIRDAGNYIPGSVHYSRRAYDKKFEIVGRITDEALDYMNLSIGGEVVLDVQEDRQQALAAVRFFRHQEV